MAVTINLKEVFQTDSQQELSEKLNFNFNQLIALGIGQPGPIGITGAAGPIGPIGPTGIQGLTGSLIYGIVPVTSATTPDPGIIPTGILVNDILITSDKILKKVTGGTGWEQLTDFTDLINTALGENISPFVKIAPNSRIIKHRVSSGLDLTNSANSANPTYATPGLPSNYQTVLYNFNELNSQSLISNLVMQISSNATITKTFSATVVAVDLVNDFITISLHGFSNGDYVTYSNEGGTSIGGLTHFSNYYVKVEDINTIQLCETDSLVPIDLTSYGNSGLSHKLIKVPTSANNIFPATSNLLIYSYFNNTADSAKEFAPSSKGYRNQIELGSIDEMATAYSGTLSSAAYLISPSFENLRIRKYRLEYTNPLTIDSENPGRYFLRAEYDLSSSGDTSISNFSPRRNSEHSWKINRASYDQNHGHTIEMRLTTNTILEETNPSNGVFVNGVHFTRSVDYSGSTPAAYFGIGFDPTNPALVSLQTSPGVIFDYKDTSFSITDTVNSQVLTVNSWEINADGIDFTIYGKDNCLLKLGFNSASSANAIVIRKDRLAQGIPFPVTQVPSTDANTLDDYEEGTWTPILYGNCVTESDIDKLVDTSVGWSNPGSPVNGILTVSVDGSSQAYTESSNIYYPNAGGDGAVRRIPIIIDFAKYIKIGKLVKCWVNFTIDSAFNYIHETYIGSYPNIYKTISVILPGPSVDEDRFDLLYQSDTHFMQNRAIGLTLPFTPVLPTSYPSSPYIVPIVPAPINQLDDVLSQTALAGEFHRVIDVRDNNLGSISTRPVLLKPAMYARPGSFVNGVPSYSSIDMTTAFAPNLAIQPITGTGRQLLKLGLVQSRYVSLLNTYFHEPAVLFYADRDIADSGNFANTPADTRTLASNQLSPVTSFDCMYAATVPNTHTAPNGSIVNALIRYSCEFSYEAAN